MMTIKVICFVYNVIMDFSQAIMYSCEKVVPVDLCWVLLETFQRKLLWSVPPVKCLSV